MEFITDTFLKDITESEVGGKAYNLYRLMALNFPVPKWGVIPVASILNLIPEGFNSLSEFEREKFISSIYFPGNFIQNIIAQFPENTLFAVRSSAVAEDGSDSSFAGQFESYLNIPEEKLEENIRKVILSSFSERVLQYRNQFNLKEKTGIGVIIQEMIHAEISGVAFSANPATGERNVKVINAVYGLGEGLVSGKLNSDNFFVCGKNITSEIVEKRDQLILDFEKNCGTKLISVEPSKQQVPALNEKQIFRISDVVDKCRTVWGKQVDIEFAYYENKFYLLQVRPITGLHKIADPNGTYILWDNSNIIESYPGVTTPLTFSFISGSYEDAYTLFCSFLGVEKSVLKKNKHVFSNTLGLINGRVYYNLKSWYLMLAMLPGYSINVRFMEKMMGVKERFDVPGTYRLPVRKAWWRICKMAFTMAFRFFSLPKKRKEFFNLLNTKVAEYQQMDLSNKRLDEIMGLYRDFETQLLNEWKAPLLNDFFAMIFFGLLEKKCKKYGIGSNPNIHNDLLCGSQDIISTQPIHRCMKLAEMICEDENLKELFKNNNENTVWKTLNRNPKFSSLKDEIDKFIYDFGERCVGELKLETISYAQEPRKFIKLLQGYVSAEIGAFKTPEKTEAEIRKNAEEAINISLKNKPFKKWFLKKIIKKTRELVSSRENLRYERTRAFGVVRKLFSEMGKRFHSEGIIETERDIFYLEKQEIFSFIEGTSVTQNIKELISLRKKEFAAYESQQPPSERFATYGPVYYANDFFASEKVEPITGNLKGIGCSPGKITGIVKVVLDVNEAGSMKGAILVTSSTDPGWTVIFPGCSGVIVERGSLLSHSAIVCREMGKPCIVSVTGLLKRLKTGDEIEMDGRTGEIKILNEGRR
jgi:pyruvate,water dikinase